MFPLKVRKIGGFRFGDKTWYTAHHLGTDYSAKTGTEVKAPFDGEVIAQVNGKQGGLTVHFRPKYDNVVMRFMHNSKFLKKGKVKEGDIIALSGNTGESTTAPHVHLDISKGSVQLSNFKNFLDPEKYQWELPKKALAGKPTSEKAPTPTTTTKVAPSAPQSVTSTNPEIKVTYVPDQVPDVGKKVDGTKIEQPNLPEKPDSSNTGNIPNGATYTAKPKIPENVQVYEPSEFWKTLLKVIISLFKRK